MPILAIETATRALGVALIEEATALSSYELLADYPHAVELPLALNRVLKEASVKLEEVEAVAVDIGPGSFTGLRIGLAFVKALVFPTKKPVVGVSSLDVLAAGLPLSAQPLCAILDARQKNVYAARYRFEDAAMIRESDYLLGPFEEVLSAVGSEEAVFVGDALARYRERLLERWPKAQLVSPEFWQPRAPILGRLAEERFRQGQRDDPATLVPMYLYPLDCSVRSPDRATSVLPQKIVSHP